MPTSPISVFKTNPYETKCHVNFQVHSPFPRTWAPLVNAIHLFGSFVEFDRLQECSFCPHPVGHTVTSASIVSPGERESGEWFGYWNVCGKNRDNLFRFIRVIGIIVIIVIIIHVFMALAWHIRKVLENIYYTSGKWTWMWEVQTGTCPIGPGHRHCWGAMCRHCPEFTSPCLELCFISGEILLQEPHEWGKCELLHTGCPTALNRHAVLQNTYQLFWDIHTFFWRLKGLKTTQSSKLVDKGTYSRADQHVDYFLSTQS